MIHNFTFDVSSLGDSPKMNFDDDAPSEKAIF